MFYTYRSLAFKARLNFNIKPEGLSMKKTAFLLIFLFWSCAAYAQGKIQDGLLKIYKGQVIGNLASCKKLKLDGVAFQYYTNGDIERQSWYEKNQLQGTTKYFSKENSLIKTQTYDHDRLVEVKVFNEAGQPAE